MSYLKNESIITEKEWYIYLSMNKPYRGYIYHEDGSISFALPEIVVTNTPLNDWGALTEFEVQVNFDYRIIDVTEEFYDSHPLDSGDAWQGGSIALGRQLNIWGINNIPTRAKPNGATPNTSIASKFFREKTPLGKMKTPPLLFRTLPRRVNLGPLGKSPLRSNNLGAVAGRAVPMVGRGLLVTGIATSGYNIYNSENKPKTIATEAGGWTGAWLGAKGGAAAGSAIGAFFGGAGAAPGALIGGIIGGALGFWGGSTIVEVTYEAVE